MQTNTTDETTITNRTIRLDHELKRLRMGTSLKKISGCARERVRSPTVREGQLCKWSWPPKEPIARPALPNGWASDTICARTLSENRWIDQLGEFSFTISDSQRISRYY
jgi:hypothetical protein